MKIQRIAGPPGKRQKPERETMQEKNGIDHTKKLWLAGVLLAACFLCGCTRKEELLMLTEEAVSDGTAENGAVGSADSGGAMAAWDEKVSSDSGGVPPLSREEAAGSESAEMPAGSGLLCVHVCGAVQAAGVYELPAGSRVCDAVQAAGGFSEDADQNYVNQAQVLADGVKLVIPTLEEAAAQGSMEAADGRAADCDAAAGKPSGEALQIGIVGGQGETAERTGAKININTASEKELCNIPGVGATRAAAIVTYRESHGAFARPEDIMKVSGIKEGMYNKIKESICVDE